MIESFLNYMRDQDWAVEVNERQVFCLPEPMKSRYAGYPESWIQLISVVKSIVCRDEHLPIFLSLEGGYAYYAISMKDGSVVHGTEPEFEECETVADSFTDFMGKVTGGRIRL